MALKSRKERPHILARHRLLACLEALEKTGIKQIPGERALCTELGVSAITVRKAIKQLASEGRIVCVPRKGNFLSEVPKYLNIGMVVPSSAAVNFLHSAPVISGIIDACEEACVHIRTVLLREPERAPRVLADYNLDGCIWSLFDVSQFHQVAKACTASSVPIVTVVYYEYRDPEKLDLPAIRVEPDFRGIGALRARFLLDRGHRAIACLTDSATEVYKGFCAQIVAAGAVHKPEWAIPIKNIFERTHSILDEGEASGLIINGGPATIEKILQSLDDHPAGDRLELVLDYAGPSTAMLLKKHPRLKVVGINRNPGKDLGIAAVRLMLDHLQGGRPLVSVRLLSQIHPLAEVPAM